MSDRLPSPIDKNLYDDEISISELLMKLWSKRGLIVFLPLVLAGLTVAGLLVTKVSSSDKLSYYIELTGLKDNAYPNGTAFSPQDLLNPQVTAELKERFALDSGANIGQSMQAAFGSPLSEGVLTEYRAALSANSKASPEELALINERYDERVNAARRRGLRIEVDYEELGLSESQGAELAYALPRVWAQVFSSRFRIFIDAGITRLPTVESFSDITTTVGAVEADLQLKRMNAGINILRNDTRFRALEVNGMSPGDLGSRVADFQRIYFNPLYTSTFRGQGGLDGLSKVYRQDLVLQLTELKASLDELNQRITSITELQRVTTNSSTGRGDFNNGSSQVQIEGDALNQLVSLSRTASLSEYLQTSFDERIELIQRQAAIRTELEKMGKRNDSDSDSDSDSDRLLSDGFIATASALFIDIQESYGQLLKQAQKTALAETPSLYEVSTQVQGNKLLQRRDFLFIALALALGGMLAVIAALLWPKRAE